MTVVNPPGFLQNAGATHTAEQFRNWMAIAGSANAVSSGSLVPRGGVHPGIGNKLEVQQSGSPGMSVVVRSGTAFIPGSQGSKQGGYSVLNDADFTLAIGASHATLHRIDLICFKVEDQAYSGVVNTSSLVVVAGTPAASPVAPAAPNNSITLASVSIVANDTSITNGEITDLRTYHASTGGIILVSSKAERDALIQHDGLTIIRTELAGNPINISAGSTWFWHSRPLTANVATSQTTASTTYTNLTTVGPSVSVETGSTALVTVSARFRNTGVNRTRMSYDISGATSISASDARALEGESTGWIKASFTFLQAGLTAGTNVFKAEYAVTAGTGTWEDRDITVEPA